MCANPNQTRVCVHMQAHTPVSDKLRPRFMDKAEGWGVLPGSMPISARDALAALALGLAASAVALASWVLAAAALAMALAAALVRGRVARPDAPQRRERRAVPDPPEPIWCEVCQFCLNGEHQWADHVDGRLHAKNLRRRRRRQ